MGAQAGLPLFVQRMARGSGHSSAPQSGMLTFGQHLRRASSGGASLEPAARTHLEEHLNTDLSSVRVHTDKESDHLARSVHANAFTSGSHIFFREGAWGPHTSAGLQTLAHEAVHVKQQSAGPVAGVPAAPGVKVSQPSDGFEQEAERVAKQASAGTGPQYFSGGQANRESGGVREQSAGQGQTGISIQREPKGPDPVQPQGQAPAQQASTDPQFILMNPGLETDPGLRNAMQLLQRYAPTVRVSDIQFRVMDEANRGTYLGASLQENGRSFWEGNVPVIELPASMHETLSQHVKGTAPVSEVHAVLRTIGHEMYHLMRGRTGNQSNPIQPVYDAEAIKQMENVHQNWLRFVQDPAGKKTLGIPTNLKIDKWEDIPEAQRKSIDTGATQTSAIQGLYEQSAYLVEEIYVRIEELSYLRVQQQNEASGKGPSQGEIREIAHLVYFFNNLLESAAQSGSSLVTPQLLAQTHTAMLAYLRKRYPNSRNAGLDSYEVVFYLSALNGGLPPLYGGDGKLVSLAPPGARVP